MWEIAIKHSLGRGDMPVSGPQALSYFQESGFLMLAVSAEHAATVGDLPNHHADPFDRLLIAQAIVRGEPVIIIDLPASYLHRHERAAGRFRRSSTVLRAHGRYTQAG